MQTHGVNNAMALKAAPIWWLLSGNPQDRAAFTQQLQELDRYQGLPNGMFSGDEHFAGRDLFHGLVRVEAPATDETLAQADAISRHLLAERAPMSNDPRADRLLYGIHDVERFLRAQGA